MLDRILRMLGYVPASSMRLLPDGASQSVNFPLHQLHADGFDLGRAHVDALCARHEGGDGSHYAIGRDDWAPLAVAGFSLSDNGECRAWLNDALRVRVWITHDVLTSWLHVNRVVLDGFCVKIDNDRPPLRSQSALRHEQEIVPQLRATEMGELFALTWKRYHLASPFRKLGNSVAYDTLSSHHALRLASETNEHALDRVVEWLALWLEARGLEVDHKDQTVYLPGYQALYFRSDAQQWP